MSGQGAEVVLVHGLWVSSWSMGVLARHLREAGFRTRRFKYSTTKQDLEQQVEGLYEFALGEDGTLPNFVCHSMGGLVTLQMLQAHPSTPSGRVVLMGSPLQGSSVAKRISKWPGGHAMLGAAESTLASGVRGWPENREIGMIAGVRTFGLGILAGGARDRGDGTVMPEESRHEALNDHIDLPVTHTSMLFSRKVSTHAAEFLRQGHFTRDGGNPR